MSTTDVETDREALRRKLAKQAAGMEASQAEIKAWAQRMREREEQRKKSAAEFAAETKRLERERGQATARHQAASSALERLRQEFVPLEVRHGLSAAKRDLDQARLRLKNAQNDLAGAREQFELLRHRVATVPSGASPADLKKALKEAEEAVYAPEARVATLAAEVKAEEAKLDLAQKAYDSAMRAALDL